MIYDERYWMGLGMVHANVGILGAKKNSPKNIVFRGVLVR